MRFKELITEVPFYQIEQRMVELYPDEGKNIEGYEDVYERLKLMDVEESNMTLHIKHFRNEWTSEKGHHEFIIGDMDLSFTNEEDKHYVDEGYDVYGTDGSMYTEEGQKGGHFPEEWIGQTVTWALEFRSWPEWLGFKVCSKSLHKLGELDYVVHALYELTFNGFTQEQLDERNEVLEEIKKTAEKYRSLSEEEHQKKIENGELLEIKTNRLDKKED